MSIDKSYKYKWFYITRVVYYDFLDRKFRYTNKSLYWAVTKKEPEKVLASMMIGNETAPPREQYYCKWDEVFISKNIRECQSYVDVITREILNICKKTQTV